MITDWYFCIQRLTVHILYHYQIPVKYSVYDSMHSIATYIQVSSKFKMFFSYNSTSGMSIVMMSHFQSQTCIMRHHRKKKTNKQKYDLCDQICELICIFLCPTIHFHMSRLILSTIIRSHFNIPELKISNSAYKIYHVQVLFNNTTQSLLTLSLGSKAESVLLKQQCCV